MSASRSKLISPVIEWDGWLKKSMTGLNRRSVNAELQQFQAESIVMNEEITGEHAPSVVRPVHTQNDWKSFQQRRVFAVG